MGIATEQAPARDAQAIALSLVSHTNAGKTTLARTLLGRDVGTVRDAPHVTDFADVYEMLRTAHGERLLLWDTPGFGDSLRLARRLHQSAQPIGWLLSAVWDRLRDRPFWASQQAVRNVRDEADVVLYLVNASESPAAATYVAPEMEVLGWIGKPVIVLLNQLGPPGDAQAEAADLQRWRQHLAGQLLVRAVLPLDAFARCWVQEGVLLQALAQALPPPQRPLMQRLQQAWRRQRLLVLAQSSEVLAASLARGATHRIALPDAGGLGGRLRRAGGALVQGVGQALQSLGASAPEGPSRASGPAETAARELAQRWDQDVRDSTRALMGLHGLQGQAQGEVLEMLGTQTDLKLRLDEGQAALWGSVVTGALAGLKADVLAGGMTLGGGLLAGGLLGALGGAGVAKGVNKVRGTEQSWARWNTETLGQMLQASLLRYLAVAHFGRGRGDWKPSRVPPRWEQAVQQALAAQGAALQAVWALREGGGPEPLPGAAADGSAPALQAGLEVALQPVIQHLLSEVLRSLYPQAAELLEAPLEGAEAGQSEMVAVQR
jgi:hypothetical protein